MNDDQIQIMKEVTAGIFYAMLSLYDEAAERESVRLLRDAVDFGAIKHPVARSILTAIVRSPRSMQLEAA